MDELTRFFLEPQPGLHRHYEVLRALCVEGVCCRLVRGFDLKEDDALAALTDWNRACEPPWSEPDLRG